MASKIAAIFTDRTGSPTERAESPLGDVPEAAPGADTSTMHFSIKSNLGWIPWKERECSLYRYHDANEAYLKEALLPSGAS